MATEEEVVRAALELQAEFLDDLGKSSEAFAVRQRVPLSQSAGVPASDGSAPQTDTPSDLPPISEDASAGRQGQIDVTALSSERYGSVLSASALPTRALEAVYVVGDGFCATLHGGDGPGDVEQPWSGFFLANPDQFSIWVHALSEFRDEYPVDVRRFIAPISAFDSDVDLDDLHSTSANLSLERRLSIYHFLSYGIDPHLELMNGSNRARYLRLVRNVGSALRIPDSSVLYVVSYLLRKRL